MTAEVPMKIAIRRPEKSDRQNAVDEVQEQINVLKQQTQKQIRMLEQQWQERVGVLEQQMGEKQKQIKELEQDKQQFEDVRGHLKVPQSFTLWGEI